MSDKRRLFIRSLEPVASSGGPTGLVTAPSSGSGASVVAKPLARSEPLSEKANVSVRKKFISNLNSVGTSQPPNPESETVKEEASAIFSLQGLMSFKDTASGILEGKTAREAKVPDRKRPNYNNAKRKFHSKMPDRMPFLD